MALFNRRKNQTNVPAEIQEYYQTERRERAGVAWLLALGTLVLTVLLAAGIFFGGRWTYRKIAGTDNNDTSTQVSQESPDDRQEEQPAQTDHSGDSQQKDQNNQQSEEQKKAEEEKKAAEEKAAADKKAEEEKAAAEKAEADRKAAEEKKKADEAAAAKKAEEDRKVAAAQREQRAATPTTGDSGQVAGSNTTTPNTGPEDTFGIAAIVAVAGYLIHRIVSGARVAKRQ